MFGSHKCYCGLLVLKLLMLGQISIRAELPQGSWFNTGDSLSPPDALAIDWLDDVQEARVGGNFNIVERSDGRLFSWGWGGVAVIPKAAQEGVRDFSAGMRHASALLNDGSVVSWGDFGFSGEPLIPPSEALMGIKAISSGGEHTLALRSNGSVIAWGAGTDGTVFSPFTDEVGQSVVPPAAMSGVVAISAGAYHSVILKDDGSVHAWGLGATDQSINPSFEAYGQADVPPEASSGIIAIAAGGVHTLALKSNGDLLAWGSSPNGQAIIPQGWDTDIIEIAAGRSVAMARRSNGNWLVWDPSTGLERLFGFGVEYEQVSLGPSSDRILHLFPNLPLRVIPSSYGVLPIGVNTVPKALSSQVEEVSIGRSHRLVVTEDHSVQAWGVDDFYGFLNVPSSASSGVKKVAAGRTFSLALKSDGSLLHWGHLTTDSVTIPTYQGISDISAGQDFAAVIDDEQTGRAWGDDLTVRSASDVVAVSSNYEHLLFLGGNGFIRSYGRDQEGQNEVPQSVQNNAVAIAAGAYHGLALTKAGGVVAWGAGGPGSTPDSYYNFGQSQVPPEAESGVVAISATLHRSVALKKDGTVLAWGSGAERYLQRIHEVQGRVTRLSEGGAHYLKLDDVHFEDSAFKAHLANRLGLPPGSPITRSDLSQLTSLSLQGLNLTSLRGLEFAPNLKHLDLRGNPNIKRTLPDYLFAKQLDTVVVDSSSRFSVDEFLWIPYSSQDGDSLLLWVNRDLTALDLSTFDIDLSNDDNLIKLQPLTHLGIEIRDSTTDIRPIALAGYQIKDRETGSVTLDGSESFDLDGSILSYQWDWPAGSASGERIDITLLESTTTITLTITDESGAQDHATLLVTLPQTDPLEGGWVYTSTIPAEDQSELEIPITDVKDLEILQFNNGGFLLSNSGKLSTFLGPQYYSKETFIPQESSEEIVQVLSNNGVHGVIKEDGSLNLWHSRQSAPTILLPDHIRNNNAQVALSGDYGCALKTDGRVFSFELYPQHNFPPSWTVPEEAQTKVVQLLGARRWSPSAFFALKDNGDVIAWGDEENDLMILPAEAQSNVADIKIGYGHAVALKTDGSVVTWGHDSYEGYAESLLPVPDFVQSDIVGIAAGYQISLAWKADNSFVVWGDETDLVKRIRESLPHLDGPFKNAYFTGQKAYFLMEDGRVWEINQSGQGYLRKEFKPSFSNLFTGSFFGQSIFLDDKGLLLVGPVVFQILGFEGPVEAVDPAYRPKSGIMQISGTESGLETYLRQDGRVILPYGRVPPEAQTGISSISTSIGFYAALKENGEAVIWNNSYTKTPLPIPPPNATSDLKQIEAGQSHLLALKKDGSLIAWGNNEFEQLEIPVEARTNISKILVFSNLNFAISNTGSLFVWGKYSGLGEQSVVTLPQIFRDNVKDVVVDYDNVLVLRNDGLALRWALTQQHERPIPETARWGVSAIKSCAIGLQSHLFFQLDPQLQPSQSYQEAVEEAGLADANQDPSAIPFNDGVSNLEKFAFNLSLAESDRQILSENGKSGLPVSRLIPRSEGSISSVDDNFEIQYLRRKRSNLRYILERSSSLKPGSFQEVPSPEPSGFPEKIETISHDWEKITFVDRYLGSHRKAYYRVRVELVD